MTSRILALCAFLAPSVAAAAEGAAVEGDLPRRVVAADVLRLRAEPREDAAATARLRINTFVLVLLEKDGWALVRIEDEPPLEGWVRAALLTEEPLTADVARERASKGTPEERVSWAERLVGLDGTSADGWKLLREAYASAGRKDKLRFVDEVLSGRAPGTLAICRDEKVILLGRFDSKGATKTDVLPEGAPWFLVGDAPEQLAGTPFFAAAELQLRDGGERATAIGTCDQDGALYSTVPLRPVAPRAKDALARALDRTPPRKKHDPEAHFEEGAVRWFAPLFGGKLLLRFSEWHYTWSHCTGEDECGSEDSRGIAVGAGARPSSVSGFELVTEFGGC